MNLYPNLCISFIYKLYKCTSVLNIKCIIKLQNPHLQTHLFFFQTLSLCLLLQPFFCSLFPPSLFTVYIPPLIAANSSPALFQTKCAQGFPVQGPAIPPLPTPRGQHPFSRFYVFLIAVSCFQPLAPYQAKWGLQAPRPLWSSSSDNVEPTRRPRQSLTPGYVPTGVRGVTGGRSSTTTFIWGPDLGFDGINHGWRRSFKACQ